MATVPVGGGDDRLRQCVRRGGKFTIAAAGEHHATWGQERVGGDRGDLGIGELDGEPGQDGDPESATDKALPALLAEPPRATTPLWLSGGLVFDGTGVPPRRGVSVFVDEGRIAGLADGGEAATQHAAQALGIDTQVGTIEVGKLADLVVIDGDPLADPALLSDRDQIWLVLQAGLAVAGSALERTIG